MASETKIDTLAAAAMLDALVDLMDAGSQPGEIHIFTGSTNADASVTPAGTLLAKLVCSATAFGAATDASPSVATAASITSDTDADDGGVAGCFWAGGVSTPGTMESGFIQGSAGEAADSTDLTFDDKTIVSGGTVAITAWTISQPTE